MAVAIAAVFMTVGIGAPVAAQVGPPDVIYAQSEGPAIIIPGSPTEILTSGNRGFVLYQDGPGAGVLLFDGSANPLSVDLGGGVAESLALTPDGQELWVTVSGEQRDPRLASENRIIVLDVNPDRPSYGTILESIDAGGKNGLGSIAFLPDGRVLVLHRGEGSVLILDRETLATLGTLLSADGLESMVYSSAANQVVVASLSQPYLRSFNAETLSPVAQWNALPYFPSQATLVVGAGERVYWLDASGRLEVLTVDHDSIDSESTIETSALGLGRGVELSSGRFVFTSPDTGSVIVVDVDPQSPTAFLPIADFPVGDQPFGVAEIAQSSNSVWISEPSSGTVMTVELPIDRLFVRGDCSGDGEVNVGDPIALLSSLFDSGTELAYVCADACDANDDGTIDVGDVIQGLDVLFGGASAFPAPYPQCGLDDTADLLTCQGSLICP